MIKNKILDQITKTVSKVKKLYVFLVTGKKSCPSLLFVTIPIENCLQFTTISRKICIL